MTLELPVIARVAAALVVALLISFISTPVVKSIAQRVGAMDIPKDNRRMHHHPIPRMGGLAIFLGFLLSALIFVPMDQANRGMLLGAVVIVILGIFDDIYALPALPKLLVQIGAALIAVLHGNVIEVLSNPNLFSENPYWSLGSLAIPLSVIWIVAITNAVNLIDGLDGLAVGVATISSLTMLVIAMLVSEGMVALMMASLAGGCIGFMPYNMNPAKIFMGDTGSTFLGFILAVVSIQGLFKFYTIISFAVPGSGHPVCGQRHSGLVRCGAHHQRCLKGDCPAVRPVPGRGDLRQDFPQQPQRQPQRTHRATKGGRQPCP